MNDISARYAIYFCPQENSALDKFGQEWLSPHDRMPPAWVSDTTLWEQATRSPAHYGFHGTLKAPFRLANGKTEGDLIAAARQTARTIEPFDSPPLTLKRLGNFLALVFDQGCPKMAALHATVLTEFEPFRAPLNDHETAKRLSSRLSSAQKGHLDRFGYPYVMDEFRFHLTLAGNLNDDSIEKVEEFLCGKTSQFLSNPLSVSDICVSFQSDKKTPFRVKERIALAG